MKYSNNVLLKEALIMGLLPFLKRELGYVLRKCMTFPV
jgi:hypothetical protein